VVLHVRRGPGCAQQRHTKLLLFFGQGQTLLAIAEWILTKQLGMQLERVWDPDAKHYRFEPK